MKLLIVLALAITVSQSSSSDSFHQLGFPEGRIINGQEAAEGEAPFIVSLKRTSHFCGGSIIAANWVVTAAHCLTYESFYVVAGLHERNNESDAQVRKVPSRAFQFVHERYGGGVGPYDIGLIYFADPFDLNVSAAVGNIRLASGKYSVFGRGKLYGWGRDNTGALPNTLQTLNVSIIGYKQCKAALPSSAPLARGNICSYTAGTSDGACNGDSGGPLVRHTPDGGELVGIVSWGYIPCATTEYPSVYTMTSAFRQWIRKTVANFNTTTPDLFN